MKYAALIGLCVALSANAAFASDRSQWDGIALSKAQEAVKEQLRDPGSAQFKNVFVFRPASAGGAPQAVCGEVNSKNGFGGYGGYTLFVWVPLGPDLKPNLDHGTTLIGDEARKLKELCRDK